MQDDIGFRRILSVSSIYDFFQDLVGVKDSRKWMAKTFWRLNGGEKIVDVGCGPGAILDYLPADVVYRGFDTSDAYMVYKRVLGHGLHFFGPKFCVRVDDPQCFFVEGSESHRTQVDVPNAVVDLLQAHVLADARE